MQPKPQMSLVPCRWQKSGWKYVEVDPAASKYFASPNRVNSVGFSPNSKAQMHESYLQGDQRQFFKEDPFAQTTYSAHFKTGADEKQRETPSLPKQPPVDGIHWAGGLHSRNDFNKRKDPIVNWTEVHFRN